MLRARLEKLRTLMRKHDFNCVAIMPGPNMHYFAGLGFHLSERPILAFFPSEGDPALVVPGFESFKATNSTGPFAWRVFAWSDEEGVGNAFAACCQVLQLANKRVGVEKLGMRVEEYWLLQTHAPGVAALPADPLITTMRQVKDAAELKKMKAAVKLVEAVLEDTLPKIKIGMTEKEVAAELMVGLFKGGSEALPFEPLVQTGPTSATPHAHPGDRKIAEGDLLIIDIGARVDGYTSDLTRTFAVGTISEKAKQIYELVKQANVEARQAARPGLTCEALDQVARTIIDEADYGEYFIHRTGHGLGLEGHESPYIVEGNTNLLEPGMTFTIEPGVYIQGIGGVRIEDNVVITKTGAETLTTFSRDLMTVG